MKFISTPFRYLSSFAGEQLIGHYISRVGPDIEVCLINGRYQINAGSVNYSFGPLHDAFRRYFRRDPPVTEPGAPVLILGFGGGSVAVILREELELANPITGVELDEAMLLAGHEHFGIGRIQDLVIHQMDAFEYILQCTQKYALIIVDIYVDDKVPQAFESLDFIAAVKECLAPAGKLVFNKLVSDEETAHERMALEDIFSGIFDQCKTYEIPVCKQSPNCMITGTVD